MQLRPRYPDPLAANPGIPLLESADLPVDDDWAILGAMRHDDDDDFEPTLSPDFD